MEPVAVSAWTAVSAVGAGNAATLGAMRAGRSALRVNDFDGARAAGWIGRVPHAEDVTLPDDLAHYHCRTHQLAWLALTSDGFIDRVTAVRERVGASRVAVLTGSSTSGIWSTEQAYRQRDASGALPNWLDYRHVHSYGALPMFVRDALRLNGPTQSVSTACSSSAKVFAAAARWIALGLCDAAVVGGVDSLCGTTIHGFHSLQLVATDPCRPFDASRSGISLGEAGAFALLERAPADGVAMRGRIALLGYGESADAHHMSSPHPEGLGAIAAMQGALAMSGLPPARVNHVCAHGTATRFNDETEARAARAVLGERCVVTSNKGIMGHTLGAAGAMSAVVSLLSIEHGVVPPTVNTVQIDPACAVDVPLTARESEVGAVLVNAFGFGGNNSSLVLGRVR